MSSPHSVEGWALREGAAQCTADGPSLKSCKAQVGVLPECSLKLEAVTRKALTGVF